MFEKIIATAISKEMKKSLPNVDFEGKYEVGSWNDAFPTSFSFPLKKK